MKLKKLELTGFKSFQDKTQIEFPLGISAIVGPNGCGKSNVVDAIRWVMGEQSVKQLRGKSREDIIFSGAAGRPPLNFAEVNLVLGNDNGSAPEELKEFSEIMVTRRLYRSGQSDYQLNKQPCRLKDIYNVFLGSGMGAKSYAVIQQGNIGAITEAGPDERRLFIEEAAGTTRYKARKKEAMSKVASTSQNLLRLNDIILEIERQMKGLKRQARKAERFQKQRSRLRDFEIHLGLHQYDGLTREIENTDELLKGLKDTDMAHNSRIRKLDAAVEAVKLKRRRKGETISELKSRIFEARRKADRLENQLVHGKDEIKRLKEEGDALESARLALEKKIAGIAAEIEEADSQGRRRQREIDNIQQAIVGERASSEDLRQRSNAARQALEKEKNELMERVAQEARYKNIFQNAVSSQENLTRRLKRKDEEEALAKKRVREGERGETGARRRMQRLKAAAGELDGKIENIRQRLDHKSQALGAQVKKAQKLEFEKNRVVSRYGALKKMEDSFQWYRDGVKAVMTARGTHLQDAADGSRAESEKAAAAGETQPWARQVLGLMADVIHPQPSYETAVEAVLGEALQYVLVEGQKTGEQAVAFLQNQAAGRCGFIPVTALKSMPGSPTAAADGPPCLLDFVDITAGYEEICRTLLGHVVIVDRLALALEVFNRNGKWQTVVTKDGDLISPQGIISGGSKENLSGILTKKKEIKDLKNQLTNLKHQLKEARDVQAGMESELRDVEKQLQQSIAARQQVSRDEIEAEKACYKTGETLKNARRYLEIVRLEQEQLMGEAMDVDEEMAEYNSALAEISNEVQTARRTVAQASQEISLLSEKLETFDRRLVELKLERTSQKARLENNHHTLRRLGEFKTDAVSRLEQLDNDIALKKAKEKATRSQLSGWQEALSRVYDDFRLMEENLGQNEADYASFNTLLEKNESNIVEIRSQREEVSQKIGLLELEQSQRKLKQENIVVRFKERYHKPLAALRRDYSPPGQGKRGARAICVEELENEIGRCQKRIERMGNVNLGAIEEYEELKKRYDFLIEQRQDLVQAVEDLQKVIRKINRITQKRFLRTLTLINEKLEKVFPRLFEGGSARLELTQPDKPLESGVEFMIHPPGKKLTRMSLLSGGEKALSAIAFIFAIFLIRPASFCLLDEIDAPLDEANIFRFNHLLKMIGEQSQIVMVTHNKRTMEFADTLFGITMEQKGVSKVVSVNLERPGPMESVQG